MANHLKDLVKQKEQSIFNKMISDDGVRLSYDQIRQLKSTLKSDYVRKVLDDDREVNRFVADTKVKCQS